MKEGDRVGAILSGKDKKVDFIGYGRYVGSRVPKEAVGWMAEVLIEANVKNPCIELDDGKVVYGCECWWGPESAVQKMLEGAEVTEIDIDEYRNKFRL